MDQITERRVKDLVTTDHRTAAIFEKYSIDFCCNGGKTVGTACEEKGVDPTRVAEELEELWNRGTQHGFRPAEWELDALADFIVNNHHRYVRRMIPVISQHLHKTVSVHGANHPELVRIAGAFGSVTGELLHHMVKEEIVVFPYIRALVSAETDAGPFQQAPFGSIRNPIRMMELEHQSAGNALAEIRRASNDYVAPVDACTTFRVMYQELREFELDLHQHVHLENNILFPKAVDLESRTLSPA